MNKWGVQSFIACTLAANLSLLTAAAPAIGVAISSGSVTVDNAIVPGNATLFDGNTVVTGATSSRLQMKDGKLARLGSESSAKIYSDHIVLEKGFGETYGNMGVDASSLRIAGDSARVSIHGKTVEVAALGSPVTVSTSTGIEVANLMPGRALAFTPQDAGAMAPATLTGCVRKVGEFFFLTDTTSNVTVQLMGGGIEKYVKHTVTVTGTPASGSTPAAGASQVLNLSNVNDQGPVKRCVAGGAGAVGPAVSGVSTGAVVIAGIAVAAGLGVTAGVLATQNESTSAVTLSPAP
jgi:hypothetical protein